MSTNKNPSPVFVPTSQTIQKRINKLYEQAEEMPDGDVKEQVFRQIDGQERIKIPLEKQEVDKGIGPAKITSKKATFKI